MLSDLEKIKNDVKPNVATPRKRIFRDSYRNIHRRTQANDYVSASLSGKEKVLSGSVMSTFCGVNNSALYGPCIASDFWSLQVSALGPVYSGVPFNFTVEKKDAYGSTILSDSSSLLQAIPLLANTEETDARTSILGSAVGKMINGVASFLFAVKATFTKIDYVRQSASIFTPIFLSFEGTDSTSGLTIKSGLVPLSVQQGVEMCPQGYVLLLDQQDEFNGSAVCTLCKPGSYSLSPLAHMPGSTSETPSCLSCPAGCNCIQGGAEIQCSIGTWRDIEGIYRLMSCPAGFQLINSTAGTSQGAFSSDLQQCRACLSGQYIVNPNTDICEDCPPGLLNLFITCALSISCFLAKLY